MFETAFNKLHLYTNYELQDIINNLKKKDK